MSDRWTCFRDNRGCEYESGRPVVDEGESETNEAHTYCDCCERLFWWDELATADDGETWVCGSCADALGRGVAQETQQ